MVRTNLCGGADRSNNFMSVAERFTAETAIFEQFPLSDSLGLSSLMAIDEVNVAFATENGFVGIGNSSLVKWTLKVSTGKGYVASGMCRDTSGNLYCVSTTGYMIKISPDGIMQWRKRLLSDHAGPIIWLDLLSVKDGIVACGDTTMFKVNVDGQIMWRQDRSSTPVRTISADKNGNLYASHSMGEIGGTDTLLCYNPEGRVRWKAVLPFVRLTTQPLVHDDRIFVAGQRIDDGRKKPALFCFKDEGTKCW
ncbi:MAG: PQQ-binding-like beta-propeller repeat protein, partial [Candidatus Kapaibacteriota bacterium]